MNNCPTCGAPKPNDDWDWSKDWLPRPGCSPESTSVFKGMATEEACHLFVAAPELLAALKDAVEFINGHNECLEPSTHSGDREWIDHCVALHKSCQGAIAKAEGRGE